jgi:hypothetical protein
VSDRRLHAPDRVRVRPDPDRPVEVQVMGAGSLDVLHARDISEHGLGVFMPHGFESSTIQSQVELIVMLPDAAPFHVSGVLRHRTVNGPLAFFGVELVRVPESARLALRAYIQKRQTAESQPRASTPAPRLD